MMDVVCFGQKEVPTKIALTEQEQSLGLQFQEKAVVMAFPFATPGIHKFWMKDTPCPLDIVFCRNGQVIAVSSGEPFSEEKIGPDEPCDLVVELPRGQAAALGIQPSSSVLVRYSYRTLARWLGQV